MYVYIRATGEHNLFVVGFYDPTGEFITESDHSSTGSAAARVHYLNGGERPKERH